MTEDARIVVTGLGVVSPLGNDVETFHRSLLSGTSGISEYQSRFDLGYKTNRASMACEVDISGIVEPPTTSGPEAVKKSGHFPRLPQLGRAGRFAVAACHRALKDASLADPRCGLVLGTTMGEALELEASLEKRVHEDARTSHLRPVIDGTPLSMKVAAALGIEGPTHQISSSCASGNHAIDWACDLLQSDHCKALLAVGVDTLAHTVMLGFNRLFLQDPDVCRPFDLHRKGTILAEGAGALLLECADVAKERHAQALAEVAGCGLSCDADTGFKSRVTDTETLCLAAQGAMLEAGLRPQHIDFVSAHGSGTRLNDARETQFIKSLLGDHARTVPMSSIKSMLGHAQAAASSFEAIASVLSFQHDVLYPTINYRTRDPQCDLDCIPNEARECHMNVIMSNAFGFGGNNSVVIFKRWNG